MLLTILLLNLVLRLAEAGADAESSPKEGLEGGFENLVEKLEFRLREVETRMQDEKEKLETRLNEKEEAAKHRCIKP